MALNIFYGGDEIDLHTGFWCHRPAGCDETLAQVENVIRASGADIVGIEEGEYNAGVIAAALGWYANDRPSDLRPIVDRQVVTGSIYGSRSCPGGSRDRECPPAVRSVRPVPRPRRRVPSRRCWP
jgi:hypothetical protein